MLSVLDIQNLSLNDGSTFRLGTVPINHKRRGRSAVRSKTIQGSRTRPHHAPHQPPAAALTASVSGFVTPDKEPTQPTVDTVERNNVNISAENFSDLVPNDHQSLVQTLIDIQNLSLNDDLPFRLGTVPVNHKRRGRSEIRSKTFRGSRNKFCGTPQLSEQAQPVTNALERNPNVDGSSENTCEDHEQGSTRVSDLVPDERQPLFQMGRGNPRTSSGCLARRWKKTKAVRSLRNQQVEHRTRAAVASAPSCNEKQRFELIRPSTILFPLEPFQYFLVSCSASLHQELCDVAFSQGFCAISAEQTGAGGEGQLRVTGMYPKKVSDPFKAMLGLGVGSHHFAYEEMECTPRISACLKRKGISALIKPPDVFVEVFEKVQSLKTMFDGREIATVTHGIRIVAIHSQEQRSSAESRIADIKAAIQFWIKTEGYDKFATCGCCLEERNVDQGVHCTNGHFYCSVVETSGEGVASQPCFAQLIKTQLSCLRSRDEGKLICPECDEHYPTQAVAQHLPEAVFKEYNESLVASRVEKERFVLAMRFDEQLSQKVEELMKNYENANEMIKMQARCKAQEARDTIMNLSCPHRGCGAYYAEFTGCMALQCASCRKHFCGYCHTGFQNSKATHHHVRECLMNETNNGSYYATAEEIKTAQRRYRTREIKKFLRSFKKQLQNAIVIELTHDLNDLGIQPEALFEVGDLHRNLRGQG
jgi:hypothetical protein